MIFMKEGRSVAVADTRSAPLGPGDLFFAFPNQIHHYHDEELPIECVLLNFLPDICPEFAKIFKTKVPQTPVLKNAAGNPKILMAIETIIGLTKSKEEYSDTEVRGAVLVLFSEFFRSVALVDNASCDNDLVRQIINYCYENYDSDISLQSIADALHISRYYISHIFSRRLQVGFSDYINSLRINRACQLLKTGDTSITEVAYAVGYNSLRTFNRCFMNIKGMTPKEYRNKAHR
jgi:AraC-like DNA-binding protein